jgi:hypothetical protein
MSRSIRSKKAQKLRRRGWRRLLAAMWGVVVISGGRTQAMEAIVKQLDTPVSQAGTISFVLRTDKPYLNGQGQEDYAQKLVTLPGINSVSFRRNDQVVNLRYLWNEDSGPVVHDMVVDFPDLPGPESYFFQFTWDSARGLSEGYFNGRPLRLPGCSFSPWWVGNIAESVELHQGALTVDRLVVAPHYTPPAVAYAAVPAEFRGRHANLTGFPKPPEAIDVSMRRGKLLYETLMDRPESLEGWVAEGPLDLRFEDGHVLMRSKAFEGNTVFWCPRDFPDRFVAEWDFWPLSRHGLAIVFFAAKGENGEDIFDPSLPARDGNFGHYIKGAITSYHVSYFANVEQYQMGRTDSNLRKNNNFYRVGGGPVAVAPGAQGWQHIRLVKDGNRIQLTCNGRTCVDWTDDDPDRYGLPHQDGKIGLRQMTPTIGLYRNFRVWELTP